MHWIIIIKGWGTVKSEKDRALLFSDRDAEKVGFIFAGKEDTEV